MVYDDELTSVPNVEDDEQLFNYSSSPECKNIDVNVPRVDGHVLSGGDIDHLHVGPMGTV